MRLWGGVERKNLILNLGGGIEKLGGGIEKLGLESIFWNAFRITLAILFEFLGAKNKKSKKMHMFSVSKDQHIGALGACPKSGTSCRSMAQY